MLKILIISCVNELGENSITITTMLAAITITLPVVVLPHIHHGVTAVGPSGSSI